ncbi:heme-binding protein 1-like isoform X1 [Dermochelys coriacea]|uniref:heme-binding protein 1-like isoform X1 n=2 Tax=Dermochelys coriacea TaxID=27794 RepID=UPI0018E86AD5|nr:heme-binding protein 1-like isoform X1 [Dermochelys coriacea]
MGHQPLPHRRAGGNPHACEVLGYVCAGDAVDACWQQHLARAPTAYEQHFAWQRFPYCESSTRRNCGVGMARITLEDLNGLDDESLDEDEEPMDGEEQNRLFSHWETVASTHQVTLPQEMAGPIMQMTQHRQVREPVPYVTLLQHEKCEERLYPAGKWACVTKGEPMYEQSISMGFMKLMRYICKENSTGRYLGMTVPVVNEIRLSEGGTELLRDITTTYYLPGEFQPDPPVPTDPDIRIVERQPLRVLTRVFYGVTTEETILREIRHLWELLGSTDTVLRESYMVAAYENPSIPQRRNEIWFIRRAE